MLDDARASRNHRACAAKARQRSEPQFPVEEPRNAVEVAETGVTGRWKTHSSQRVAVGAAATPRSAREVGPRVPTRERSRQGGSPPPLRASRARGRSAAPRIHRRLCRGGHRSSGLWPRAQRLLDSSRQSAASLVRVRRRDRPVSRPAGRGSYPWSPCAAQEFVSNTAAVSGFSLKKAVISWAARPC